MSNERRDMEARRSNLEYDRFSVWDKRIRDIVIYIVAMAGVINQLFFVKDPSETALVFLAAMLGFPLVLRADESRRASSNGNGGRDQ